MANSVSDSKSTDRPGQKADTSNRTKILADCTLKDFPFYYMRISLVTDQRSSKSNKVDDLTIKKHITAAMTQKFGVVGSAVPIDILKLENDCAWIRIPFEDRSLVIEALSGWTGNGFAWTIKESSCWLGGMTGSNGSDLFED